MHGSKLYIGNISHSVVEMSNQAEAEKAKEALNGYDLGGRTLKVNEARSPKSRGSKGHQSYRGRR